METGLLRNPGPGRTRNHGALLPPPFKGTGGGNDAGYGVYDLYDLGEFHQKGSISTKYGDRSEYLDALRAVGATGLQVQADIVFNHRGGADDAEWVNAVRVRNEDRSREFTLDQDDYWIEACTVFNFPQRRGKTFADYLGNVSGNVTINEYGWGAFYCAGGSASVRLKRTQIP